MAIEKLALISEPNNSVYFAVNLNGQDYRLSILEVLDYIQEGLDVLDSTVQQFATQYAAPSATGFSVQINDNSGNTHLILTPTTGFAAGTLVLPSSTSAVDRQEILINSTQQVTTLTIDGNGAIAVTGEPGTIAADGFFRLKYDLPTQTWYRVG